MREYGLSDDAVEFGRWYAFVQIIGNPCDDRHETAQTTSRLCREKRDRRKLCERDEVVDHLGEFVLAEFALLFARKVPLVADNDQAFAFFDRKSREPAVLRGNADHRIEDEDRNIAACDRFERAQRRIVFDCSVRFWFLAHAGSIDEADRAVVPLQQRIDGVA